MVVDDIGGEDLDVAVDGFWVGGIESSQQGSALCAELEVGFLDEVVENLRGGFAPLSGNANDDCSDEGIEAANEFGPRFVLAVAQTGESEVYG